MDAVWKIQDDYLVLEVKDGTIIIPKAIDIFRSEFRNLDRLYSYNISKPSLTLQSIKFSRIPIKLFVEIYSERTQGINLQIKGVIKGQEYIINEPLKRHADHIIINDQWYAFESDTINEIKKQLLEVGITKTGLITLKNYFSLITIVSKYIHVVNKVDVKDVSNIIYTTEEYPDSFVGTLYPYQEIGYRWLRMIDRENIGCILADEMGLGKTIQIICLIAAHSHENTISLIIAPATILENWRREFTKFAPSLKVLIHRGFDRTGFPSELKNFNVIITSYSTLVRDTTLFNMIDWDMVVLDEAQAIKNAEAVRTRAVKELPRRLSIAVTGTPIENQLTDLWSLMDFSISELLGDKASFESTFSNNIESATRLEPIVRPVILRRTISEVANDLPERIEIPQIIELSNDIAREYDSLRREILQEYGLAATIVSINKLRMFCTNPQLVKNIQGDLLEINPKYLRLLEILEEIFNNNEKALIFTSFRGMIDLFLRDIPNRFHRVYIDWIDGRVDPSDRQEKVDSFNEHLGPGILVLNPRAAGTGLNLQAANHVIHFNLEWNPAVEDQASARVYRRGQEKPVTIHRLYYANTIEEVIADRLQYKREISEAAIVGIDGSDNDYVDILRALEITPFRGM